MRVGDRVRVVADGKTVKDWEDWPYEGEVRDITVHGEFRPQTRLHVSFEDAPGIAYGFTRDQLEYVEKEEA